MTKQLPDQETLHALLDYDPVTGKLFWKWRPLELCTSKRAQGIFNTRNAGKEAFTAKQPRGYLVGAINRQNHLAHRVIYKWMTGEDPDQIDHINGDTSDNRWSNLRSTNQQTNTQNMKLNKRNKLGVPGVYRTPSQNWQVLLSKKYLGSWPCLGQAVQARKQAERSHDYHPNHGRVA